MLWPEVGEAQLREEIFGLRFRLLLEDKGAKAAREFLEKELARDPQPHVKAYLATICFFGPAWGMGPATDYERGQRLGKEAVAAGSVAAADALGRATAYGYGCTADCKEAVRLLRLAAQGGVARAMARLGVYRTCGIGEPADAQEGALWLARAAALGGSYGYVELGGRLEDAKPGDGSNLQDAIKMYSHALVYNDDQARKKLQALVKNNTPGAALYLALGEVNFAHEGGWLPPTRVREQVKTLRELAGDDAEALVELGRACMEGKFTKRDYAFAQECFKRAAQTGNTDARFFLSKMKLRGLGVPCEAEAALRELQLMVVQRNARAAAYLGYVHYWGADEAPGIKKDAHMAFVYSRAAAEMGSFMGQRNLVTCYEHGIGTPKNYALAAKVSWIVYGWGVPAALGHTRKLLNHVDLH